MDKLEQEMGLKILVSLCKRYEKLLGAKYTLQTCVWYHVEGIENLFYETCADLYDSSAPTDTCPILTRKHEIPKYTAEINKVKEEPTDSHESVEITKTTKNCDHSVENDSNNPHLHDESQISIGKHREVIVNCDQKQKSCAIYESKTETDNLSSNSKKDSCNMKSEYNYEEKQISINEKFDDDDDDDYMNIDVTESHQYSYYHYHPTVCSTEENKPEGKPYEIVCDTENRDEKESEDKDDEIVSDIENEDEAEKESIGTGQTECVAKYDHNHKTVCGMKNKNETEHENMDAKLSETESVDKSEIDFTDSVQHLLESDHSDVKASHHDRHKVDDSKSFMFSKRKRKQVYPRRKPNCLKIVLKKRVRHKKGWYQQLMNQPDDVIKTLEDQSEKSSEDRECNDMLTDKANLKHDTSSTSKSGTNTSDGVVGRKTKKTTKSAKKAKLMKALNINPTKVRIVPKSEIKAKRSNISQKTDNKINAVENLQNNFSNTVEENETLSLIETYENNLTIDLDGDNWNNDSEETSNEKENMQNHADHREYESNCDKVRHACHLCEKTFSRKKTLYKHYRTHLEGKYNCEKCGIFMSGQTELEAHVKQHLKSRSAKKLEHKSEETDYNSYDDGTSTLSQDHVIGIQQKEQENSKVAEESEDAVFCVCTLCRVSFGSRKALSKHKLTYNYCMKAGTPHAERKYLCQDCGKAYFKKHALQRHMRSHLGERQHACSYCDFRSQEANNLKRHMALHFEAERNFVCEVCGAAFHAKKTLEAHCLYKHSNERQYKCSHCQMGFKGKSALKRHEKIHTLEKEHTCFCGSGFRRICNLRRHLRLVHGNNNYLPPVKHVELLDFHKKLPLSKTDMADQFNRSDMVHYDESHNTSLVISECTEIGNTELSHEIGNTELSHEIGNELSHEIGNTDMSHEIGNRELSHEIGNTDMSHEMGNTDMSHEIGNRELSHEIGNRELSHEIGNELSHGIGNGEHSHEIGNTDMNHEIGNPDMSHEIGNNELSHGICNPDMSHEIGNRELSHEIGNTDMSHEMGNTDMSHEIGNNELSQSTESGYDVVVTDSGCHSGVAQLPQNGSHYQQPHDIAITDNTTASIHDYTEEDMNSNTTGAEGIHPPDNLHDSTSSQHDMQEIQHDIQQQQHQHSQHISNREMLHYGNFYFPHFSNPLASTTDQPTPILPHIHMLQKQDLRDNIQMSLNKPSAKFTFSLGNPWQRLVPNDFESGYREMYSNVKFPSPYVENPFIVAQRLVNQDQRSAVHNDIYTRLAQEELTQRYLQESQRLDHMVASDKADSESSYTSCQYRVMCNSHTGQYEQVTDAKPALATDNTEDSDYLQSRHEMAAESLAQMAALAMDGNFQYPSTSHKNQML